MMFTFFAEREGHAGVRNIFVFWEPIVRVIGLIAACEAKRRSSAVRSLSGSSHRLGPCYSAR